MNPIREWTPADHEAAVRIGLVYAQRPWPGFEAAVQQYRQIEAELVEQAGEDALLVLETKRRIAEWIIKAAWRDDVPFEQLQDAWNELLALGFTDGDKKHEMVFFYADYCLNNGCYDAGLGVIEPAIAEFEEWLRGAVLKPKQRKFHEEELERQRFLRDGLVALRSGGAEAEAWLEREEARQASPQKQREDELGLELYRAMKPIFAIAADRSFAEVERAYREVETNFLARLQPGDELFEPRVRERITNAIFAAAHEHRESFEVCRDLWSQLHPWDFGHLEHRCVMVRRYAECCLFNRQSDAGLAVVEPLIAELQQHIDAGTDEDMPSERYPAEVGRLQKLRDELKAIAQ